MNHRREEKEREYGTGEPIEPTPFFDPKTDIRFIAADVYVMAGGKDSGYEFRDFLNEGWVAYLNAHKTWDGSSKKKYFEIKIKGHLIDYLRKNGVNGCVMRRVTDRENGGKYYRKYHLVTDGDGIERMRPPDPRDILDDLIKMEYTKYLHRAVEELSVYTHRIKSRDAGILDDFIFGYWTMQEIGIRHGVTESRVSQIVKKWLPELKRRIMAMRMYYPGQIKQYSI